MLLWCLLRTMAKSAEKVLVSFVKDNHPPVKAKFTESILDTLGLLAGNQMPVYVELRDNSLLLGNKPWSSFPKRVTMKRASFCPIHNLQSEMKKKLPEETISRGIDVGCAVIVESGDGKILLSRRANNLRIFPNVWVPPGGHVEINETLTEAGLRELREETGLSLSSEDCVQKKISFLAMWESVYPTMLCYGLPQRHHAVVFLYAKLLPHLTSSVLEEKLHPDPGEVSVIAWFEQKLVKAIVRSDEEENAQYTPRYVAKDLPETFRALLVQSDGTTEEGDLPTAVLLQTAAGQKCDIERVSTGTKFALSQWLLG